MELKLKLGLDVLKGIIRPAVPSNALVLDGKPIVLDGKFVILGN